MGGGYHHAHAQGSSGFCFYNDIGLTVEYLKIHHKELKKILIIDLDAHQGNGHERDKFLYSQNTIILDFYNPNIFPFDSFAKKAIDYEEHIYFRTTTQEYLERLEKILVKIFQNHIIDFVIYNGGTDILSGDRLGHLNISGRGVMERDELVIEACLSREIPVLWLLSGGY